MEKLMRAMMSCVLSALGVIGATTGVEAASTLSVSIETSRGVVELELYDQETPITVANFVNLAERGYYDGLTFHRVIPEFMVQGGCPQGTGTGGPGYKFADEIVPSLKHNAPGVLSMANAGPGTNGSQFFITHVPTPWLDGKHTVFGKVTKGQDVIDSIKGGDLIKKVTVNGNTASLKEKAASQLQNWNAVLDKSYPKK